MRNISLFAVSLVLLTSQVNVPGFGGITATASSETTAADVYEVKLNTNTASAIQIVGTQNADFDAEVLVPLRAAQAAQAETDRKTKVKAKVSRTVAKVTAVAVVGSHADWMRAAGIAE